MQHGDISDQPPARLLVVFEGLLGVWLGPPQLGGIGELLGRLLRREYTPTPEEYQINSLARDAIRDAMTKQSWHVDVVTWLGPEFARQLEEWLPGHMVHAPVLTTTPGQLARDLAHRPDIHRIYDPDPTHALTYGPRGVHLAPSGAGLIGRS